jgi:hypothetical protein
MKKQSFKLRNQAMLSTVTHILRVITAAKMISCLPVCIHTAKPTELKYRLPLSLGADFNF